MVKQTTKQIKSEINKGNQSETKAVVKYKSELLSTHVSQIKENNQPDDLIGILSEAYENKRARQVFEWERVRRQNIQQAA